MSEHITWLTQAAYDKLAEELAERSGPIREEITVRITAAREEGDLKENGGYHAAREEQGKNEGRIQHLTSLLAHAKIGSPEVPNGQAAIGRVVTIEFAPGEQEAYYIGSAEEASVSEHKVLSPGSPIGAAVIGRDIGDDFSYELPNGKVVSVTLVDVQQP